MSGYTLADALRDMRGYKERADKAESELAALRAALAEVLAERDRLRAELAEVLSAAAALRVAGEAAREELGAVIERTQAERDKWRNLVVAHNSALEITCRAWQSDGYCSAPGRPHACHDCPRDWCIDVPHNLGEGEAK